MKRLVTRNRRLMFRLSLALACLPGLLVLAWFIAWSRGRTRALPLTDLPERVFYSADREGPDFYARRAPAGTGWIRLPEPNTGSEFASGTDPYLLGFVPAHVCGECHPDQYRGFPQTAHFRTSRVATRETVLGDFSPGKNRLATKDPQLHFEMTAQEEGLFQRVVVQHEGRRYEHAARFDLVTGSGNHGQTYLYWVGDRLCQLPVSYFTESGGWVNSPGNYRDGTADFARGIGERCLGCHATYFASDPASGRRHDKTNYILGVTCVRCHGPGWAHVQYHRGHPEDSQARYVVNPADLSPERANEVCAQCHSGVGRLLQPAFAYRPGEPLADYLELDMQTDAPEHDDPHAANQLLRLMKSRCFQESPNMTCADCHDPHQHERGNLQLFSQRCARCHPADACGLAAEQGSRLQGRCVECHMPSRRDAAGTMETPRGVSLPLLRDHWIQARPGK